MADPRIRSLFFSFSCNFFFFGRVIQIVKRLQLKRVAELTIASGIDRFKNGGLHSIYYSASQHCSEYSDIENKVVCLLTTPRVC